jgi:hypothetical protein
MKPKINQIIVLLLLISVVFNSCASARTKKANGCGCPPHKWVEKG